MKYLLYIVIIPGLIVAAFLWGRMYEMTRQGMRADIRTCHYYENDRGYAKSNPRCPDKVFVEPAPPSFTPQVPKSTRSNSSL